MAFGSGTNGSISSSAGLKNGVSQIGTSCPVDQPHSQTGETSQDLAWTTSLKSSGFRYAAKPTSPQGITFLPEQLPCTAGGPVHGIFRPELQVTR